MESTYANVERTQGEKITGKEGGKIPQQNLITFELEIYMRYENWHQVDGNILGHMTQIKHIHTLTQVDTEINFTIAISCDCAQIIVFSNNKNNNSSSTRSATLSPKF